MTMPYHLVIAGMTDTGLVRKHNEDALDWDVDQGLALIADGMGGHNAGEVASRLAAETVMAKLRDVSTVLDEQRLSAVVAGTNEIIYHQAQVQPGCKKMGTTLVMLYLDQYRGFIAHVGDSRAYRLRDAQFTRLTEDHSLVRQLLEEGSISKDDALTSRYKNVITRALGVRQTCKPDIVTFDVEAGDIYLLCSDGLTDMLSDHEIRDVLVDLRVCPEEAVAVLMDQANRAGGKDNISIIVAAVAQSG